MIDQNSAFPHVPAVFKYKMLIPMCIWLVAILFLLGGLEIIAIRREGFSTAAIFILCMFLFLESLGMLGTFTASDVVIDDQGISRSLFGKTWKAIEWVKVKRVGISLVPDFARHKMDRYFIIYKADKGLRGFMSFIERVENKSELIELLNHYISKHDIKIEQSTNGIKTSLSRIEIT